MNEKQREELGVILKKNKTPSDYYELYLKAREFDNGRFYDYKELMAFYEGNQNVLSAYAGEKPWVIDITTPYATDAINVRVSSLISKEYIGELQPLSPEDQEPLEKLQMLYENQWTALNMDNHISESIQRAAVLREAYTHVVYNPDSIYGGTNTKRKGALEAYFIDPASVLIDPSALSLKEADYVIITERISLKKLVDLYPEFDFKTIKRGSQFSYEERGEVYISDAGEEEEVFTKLTFYEMENIGTKRQNVYRTVMIEDQIVEETNKMKIRVLPIAQLRWEKRMKSPYGISLMDRLLPNQKMINAIESAIGNTALAFSAPSFVVSKDSGLDPEEVAVTAGAPGMVYSVDGDIERAIKPLMSGRVVDSQMLEIKNSNEATIYKIAGVTQQFVGDIGTAGATATGTTDAINRATIIEQKFLQNLEEFIEDLTVIIVDFITRIYKGQTLYTRGEQQANGKYNFSRLELPENAEDLNYTFGVNMYSRLPYNIERNKQTLTQLFQFENQYDAPIKVLNIKDIVKSYDIPNRQEILLRYDDMVSKDNQTKSQLITDFVKLASENGIDDGMIANGIQEIIVGKDTQVVEQILKTVEQQKQMKQQQTKQRKEFVDESTLQTEKFMGQQMLQQQKTLQELQQQAAQPQNNTQGNE